MNIHTLSLKAHICGHEHVSGRLRRRINRLSGDRRHAGQLLKKELGSRTRNYLLAYGYLRGTPYRKIENNVGPGNEPVPADIVGIIHQELHSWHLRKEHTQESVRAWLEDGGGAR